jgi:hypothetical protein
MACGREHAHDRILETPCLYHSGCVVTQNRSLGSLLRITSGPNVGARIRNPINSFPRAMQVQGDNGRLSATRLKYISNLPS